MKRLTPLAFLLPLALFAAPATAQDEDSFDLDLIPEEDAPAAEKPAAEDKLPEIEEDEPDPEDVDIGEAKSFTQFDRIRAVSRKTFLKRERFAVAPFVGQSINDPFFTRYAFGTRAAYHLVEDLGLEIGGAYMVTADNEQTLSKVREQQNAVTADNPPIGYLDVGVTFSPIYGKIAVVNDWIIHFDAFVSAGAGVMIDTGDTPNPAFEVGFGARIFVLDWLVVRGDLRNYVYPQDAQNISTLQTVLMFNVGVGIYFPFDFDYRNLAFKIVG
jgi:outer membrane beta-barrel protein